MTTRKQIKGRDRQAATTTLPAQQLEAVQGGGGSFKRDLLWLAARSFHLKDPVDGAHKVAQAMSHGARVSLDKVRPWLKNKSLYEVGDPFHAVRPR